MAPVFEHNSRSRLVLSLENIPRDPISRHIKLQSLILDLGLGEWKRKHNPNQWRESLYIGYKIDIFDKAYNKWYSGEIIEINNDKNIIKIHYDGYSSNYDEYLDKHTKRIDKLNTCTAPDPFWNNNIFNNNNNTFNNYNYNFNTDDTTPPINNGCIGLRNLGNTCFMSNENMKIIIFGTDEIFINEFQNKYLTTDPNLTELLLDFPLSDLRYMCSYDKITTHDCVLIGCLNAIQENKTINQLYFKEKLNGIETKCQYTCMSKW